MLANAHHRERAHGLATLHTLASSRQFAYITNTNAHESCHGVVVSVPAHRVRGVVRKRGGQKTHQLLASEHRSTRYQNLVIPNRLRCWKRWGIPDPAAGKRRLK
jgi:hypothetical protein